MFGVLGVQFSGLRFDWATLRWQYTIKVVVGWHPRFTKKPSDMTDALRADIKDGTLSELRAALTAEVTVADALKAARLQYRLQTEEAARSSNKHWIKKLDNVAIFVVVGRFFSRWGFHETRGRKLANG